MKLTRSIVALAAAVAVPALVASPSEAATSDQRVGAPSPGQLTKEDRDFFDDAAQGGLLEVKLGQLVVKQGANDDVKRFAQRMIDDHTKVNQRLADLARQEGLGVPTELDKKHQEQYDKLAREAGDKLDHAYMDDMVSDHKTDVKAFDHQAKDGKDPGLRQFAASTLPTLNEHLALARQTQDRLSNTKK